MLHFLSTPVKPDFARGGLGVERERERGHGRDAVRHEWMGVVGMMEDGTGLGERVFV